MTEEEWRIVNAFVNYCRNNGLTYATADHQDFTITVKADNGGFELTIERDNLNGG